MTAGAEAPPPLGVYIHWPYCARICPYCDFNVVRDRGREAAKARLARVMLADLEAHARLTGPRRLVSIFFGGGTPSLMAPEAAAEFVGRARSLWAADPALEITLEANPTDAEAARFAAFAEAGVGRLSLGVQSLNDEALAFLGRDHDAAGARRAARLARAAFPRLSIDLIHSLPGQGREAWRRDLEAGLALGPEHVSAYELTIEPGAAFARRVRRGTLQPADEAARADLFDLTGEVLGAAGFEAYEISNHARTPAARSRHNRLYWRGEDYVGVGPGAHGRITLDGVRWAHEAPRAQADYVAAADKGLGSVAAALTPREAALERLLMGLRTLEGAPLEALSPLGIAPSRLAELAAFIEVEDGHLVATRRGRPVLDALAARLVDA